LDIYVNSTPVKIITGHMATLNQKKGVALGRHLADRFFSETAA
jgi:hypothetical protein